MAQQIPFTRGVPSADLLPIDSLREAARAALDGDPEAALALSYGTAAGHPALRAWIAGRHDVDPARVVCTNGSLQALLFVAEVTFAASQRRRVIVEAPTYDRAIIVLRRAGGEVVGVPQDADGLDVDALEDEIRRGGPPALVYCIPTFQNPGGATLTTERRRQLVALSQEHRFLLVEDDPYGLLRFRGERQPTLLELGGQAVVSLSSFTKTVAPGIRVGYAVAPPDLAARLTKHANDTYIGPSMLSQATLAAYCEAGCFEPGVARVTEELDRRCTAMVESVRGAFPVDASFVEPDGGYFLWVETPGVDTTALLAEATAAGVPYVKGSDFFAGRGGEHALRLAFSAVLPEQIREGIARLGGLLQQHAPAPA